MAKNIIILVLAVLLVGQFFCTRREAKQADQAYSELQGKYLLKDSAFIAEAQAARRWQTADSLNVLRVNSLAVSRDALKSYNQDLKKELEAAKIKINSIQRQTQVATSTAGEVRPKTDTVYLPATDSTPVQIAAVNFSYSDKWITMQGRVRPEVLITYKVRDSLQLYWHTVRDGFLKPKKLRLTIYSHNPNTQISGVRDFTVKTPKPRFSVNVGGGYGWNGSKFAPTVGIFAGLKLFQF